MGFEDIAASLRKLAAEVERYYTDLESLEQHLTVLEEAHRLLGRSGPASLEVANPRGKAVETFANMLAEIREYGGSSIQVMRRLRAMFEQLRESVTPDRRVAVGRELERLDRTLAEHWSTSVDLDLATAADRQGIGGPSLLGAP